LNAWLSSFASGRQADSDDVRTGRHVGDGRNGVGPVDSRDVAPIQEPGRFIPERFSNILQAKEGQGGLGSRHDLPDDLFE
jgi:hypothetical protein